MNILSKKFSSESSLMPAILGRRFRFLNEKMIYVALGLKGADNRIILQSESTEEIRDINVVDFLKLAERADV